MSGTGAPKPITGLLIDQPIVGTDGKMSIWFAQVMQRLVGYVGSPASASGGSSGGTETLSESIANLQTSQYSALGSAGSDASMQARVAALEDAVLPLPPFVSGRAAIPPALAPTWLSNGQEAASEGTGVPVLDPVNTTSETAFFRSLIGLSGISLALTADGTGIIIALTSAVDLTSGGTLVSSGGTQVTSGL